MRCRPLIWWSFSDLKVLLIKVRISCHMRVSGLFQLWWNMRVFMMPAIKLLGSSVIKCSHSDPVLSIICILSFQMTESFFKSVPYKLVEWRTVKDVNKLEVDLLILLRAILAVLNWREIELVLLDGRAQCVLKKRESKSKVHFSCIPISRLENFIFSSSEQWQLPSPVLPSAFQQAKAAEKGKMCRAWLKANGKWCLEYYKVACSFLKYFLLELSKVMVSYSKYIQWTPVGRQQRGKLISPLQSFYEIWTLLTLYFPWTNELHLRCSFYWV